MVSDYITPMPQAKLLNNYLSGLGILSGSRWNNREGAFPVR